MYRALMCGLFVLGLCAFTVLAKEYKGSVTKIELNSSTVAVIPVGLSSVGAAG
jgi:hypothetical protein